MCFDQFDHLQAFIEIKKYRCAIVLIVLVI
jgi:hypothetical protein